MLNSVLNLVSLSLLNKICVDSFTNDLIVSGFPLPLTLPCLTKFKNKIIVLSSFSKFLKPDPKSSQVSHTYSGNEGDDLPGGDAVPSAVPRKVRGIPVVRFALGTSNLLS